MSTKKDISGIDDIKQFVNDFYAKVKEDPLLAPEFFSRIPGDWQPHLEKMYLFWNAALFGEKGYIGNPFSKHATMNISAQHFDKWLLLFYETIDTLFEGPLASDAKWRASIMAENFLRRLEDARLNNSKTII